MSGLHLDQLLGKEVVTREGVRIGRIEEFRARRQGAGIIVDEFVLGEAGVLERLNVWARLIVGLRRSGYVAAVKQIDISNLDRPQLTCGIEELQRL